MSEVIHHQRKKVALVTGASSGIGYAISNELATRGYTVYACARRVEPMTPLIKEHAKGVIIPVQLDVTNLKEILAFKERLGKELPEGKLDVLYNNAGQSCTLPALDCTDEQTRQCFNVNVFGHINMTRELSQYVINGKGTILFTGSLSGIFQFPFGSVYAATKAAIHQYARVLHTEMKPFGVRVINVVTGGVNTNIADTRPIPKGSVYDFDSCQEAFENRQLMAKKNHPMDPKVYAKKIVDDIQSKKDPVDVYRGTMASILHWVTILIPYWLIEWGVVKKFKLDKAFAHIKEISDKRDSKKHA